MAPTQVSKRTSNTSKRETVVVDGRKVFKASGKLVGKPRRSQPTTPTTPDNATTATATATATRASASATTPSRRIPLASTTPTVAPGTTSSRGVPAQARPVTFQNLSPAQRMKCSQGLQRKNTQLAVKLVHQALAVAKLTGAFEDVLRKIAPLVAKQIRSDKEKQRGVVDATVATMYL